MTRVAAVDCGTNSIRLLVVASKEGGTPEELCREVRLARLGQGVDATGEFHADALARTFAVCDEFADIIDLDDLVEPVSKLAKNKREVFIRPRLLGYEPTLALLGLSAS